MEQVSIIIPVFNGEIYLPACLDSILTQSFRDFRVYLIDDGSTDKTPEICRAYSAQDGRIRYLRQENRGVSAARNVGLLQANGEFLTFCDADDFWETDHLQTLVQAIRETGADMVSCNYAHVDTRGNLLHWTAFSAEIRELISREAKGDYIRDVLSWKTGWAVWARIFRRDAVKHLTFCEDCRCGEDLLFVVEAAFCCRRAASIAGSGYRYRQHPGSAMARTTDALAQRAAGACWLWHRLEKLGPERDNIAWEILRPVLEEIPAAKLPGELKKLPQNPWLRELARRVDSPLARFCVHGCVLRYRIERRFGGFHITVQQ